MKPWTTQRVFVFSHEGRSFGAGGSYDPLLGYSYTEIGGMAGSRHESQAMGTAQSVGPPRVYLKNLAGEPASWRFPGRYRDRWPAAYLRKSRFLT